MINWAMCVTYCQNVRIDEKINNRSLRDWDLYICASLVVRACVLLIVSFRRELRYPLTITNRQQHQHKNKLKWNTAIIHSTGDLYTWVFALCVVECSFRFELVIRANRQLHQYKDELKWNTKMMLFIRDVNRHVQCN